MNAKKTFQLFLIEAKDRRLQTFPRRVFENHRKSLIQHCERSELRLQFIKSAKNGSFSKVFWNINAYGQTVLPDFGVKIQIFFKHYGW